MLRVALLTPCFWPEVRRGTERLARELADGLLARGHQPELITSHPGRPGRTVEDGLPVIRHWRPPHRFLERRGFELYLSHPPFSYLSLRRGDYDVAQAFYVTDAQAAARWTARTGRPSVFAYMGIPDDHGLDWRRGRRMLTERAVSGCTAVTALSGVAAGAFRETLGVEARTIPPGVDLEAFRPSPTRAPAPTLFSAVDLREPRKRAGLLVEAFRLLRESVPDCRLVLSRPPDLAAAERFAAENPDVELVDVDDREALARAYGEAWTVVLPSFNEAFGLVLVEALACGTPVVAADDGGMREVVDRSEVGRLFAGERAEDLLPALREALALSREPRTAEACRRRAADFSTDAAAERHLALYEELLAGGS